ncbi:MAG: DUF1553 domain-containing protein [Planctomycetaceae bacterium]|nr:DUF1553 domain-containing protein [Planctomycetaceae bacterium]
MKRIPKAACRFICSAVLLTVPAGSHLRAADVRFNRDIRPILSARCVKCHGPDAAHREADLRLDTADGVRKVFSGKLENSEGWARISSTDPDLVMPPPGSHSEMEPVEVETLKTWISNGGQWEGHWAFIPPQRPTVPDENTLVSDGQIPEGARNWIRNPIDAFILRRALGAGLIPNGDADKERLIRRVTLDLTGLPPTLAEVDAFVSDESPDAYEKVVDRLLASPQYGERMAVVWMDAARYGDTSVFHADGKRDMWPWRDWVISAYNQNMPFDEFTIEQLAGDLIPDATTSQKLATGFLRNNATTDEGGLIEEEYRVEYAVDRVKTTSMVWLGLSMECGQCHSHKYDPISHDEYYQFFAFFNQAADPGRQTRNGNESPILDLFDDAKLANADQLSAQLDVLRQQAAERTAAAESDFQAWLVTASEKASRQPLIPEDVLAWFPLDEDKGRAVANLAPNSAPGRIEGAPKRQDGRSGKALDCDGSNFVNCGEAGRFERDHGFSYGCWVRPADGVTGAPIARMDDSNGHRGYDLLLSDGTIQVHIINTWPGNAIKVRTKDKIKAGDWQHLFVTYDGTSKASGVRIYVDGVVKEWEIEQDGLTESIQTDVPLHIGRRSSSTPFKGLIDEVRLYNRALSAEEVSALAGNDPITPLLAKADRSEDEIKVLRTYFLTSVDAPSKELAKQQTELSGRINELRKPYINVMVMANAGQMRDTFVLDRGSYASPLQDRKVEPGVPAVLPPLPEGAPANRLGMAQWLVQDTHPLTARVTVNRYWAMLFGEGIVRTLEEFGAQGEWPTHPDLLDWLAVDFVDSGWDVKRTLKQMVMSSTYRQSSVISPQKLAADPENRLLARGARFRLQGEFIRDNALAVSGLLVPTIGGPGVKPYQPPGLWNEVSLDGNLRFTQDHGENLYRRSLYTFWKRSAPAPSMTIFDAPTREKCTLRRGRTNTPLQALVTLNDVQFVEAARVLAERAIAAHPDNIDAQIEFIYRTVAAVRPSAQVQALLRSTYDEERTQFEGDRERALKLIAAGEAPRNEQLPPETHAAMTIIASIVLNLDEVLSRG